MEETKQEGFEVCDFVPMATNRSGINHNDAFMAAAKLLLTVPEGKSIRKGFLDVKLARSFTNSLRVFLSRNGLMKQYFTRLSGKPEGDGRYYVYVARKLK